jgi:predicted nucleotidyltransferase
MEARERIELINFLKNEVHNRNGILLNVCISGSHLYGWESEDSDVDIRGTFALNHREFFKLCTNGLPRSKRTMQIKNHPNPDYDIEFFELGNATEKALKSNCTIHEMLHAPQIYQTKEFIDYLPTVRNVWGKTIHYSYKGMTMNNYEDFICKGRATAKKWLYVFRGILAGLYALEQHEIEPNMNILAKYYRTPGIKKILKIKKEGKEDEPFHDSDTGEIDALYNKLLDKFDKAYEKSDLPYGPTKEEKNKAWNMVATIRQELGMNR